MKKAFVLLLALAVIGGAAFAEDAAYTLTGSASLTWGYDLNTEAHGFTNAMTSTITLPLVAKGSSSKGEEAITGQIMLKDFAISLKDSAGTDTITITSGAVTAKILLPSNLYVAIYGMPTFAVNYATSFAPWVADAFDDTNGLVAPELTAAGGFSLGMTGDLSFSLNVGSTNKHTAVAAAATDAVYGWVDDDDDETTPPTWGVETAAGAAGADPANQYMAGVNVGYTVADLVTVGAKAIYGNIGADSTTIGLGVNVSATPMDGLAVVLATDVSVAAVTGLDVMFTADYSLAELLSFGAGAYYGMADLAAAASRLDAKVRLGLLAVENLTLDVGVDLWDLAANPAINPMLVLVGGNASYKYMLSDATYVKPYAAGGYELNDEVLALDVGLEAMLFPMTTFKLDFTAGKLATDNVTGGSNGFGTDKGIFTFVTTIAY
jgi:hypothetical protein